MVLHPVDDLDRALAFYQEALGLSLEFRDGDRFCALDADGVTIALAAGGEKSSTGGAVTVAYEVEDVSSAAEQLVAAGAGVVRVAEEGPHEVRAILRDTAGNDFVIYSPRQAEGAE